MQQGMGGASVDAGAALALAGAYGVTGPLAAFLIGEASRGILAGIAKSRDGGPD